MTDAWRGRKVRFPRGANTDYLALKSHREGLDGKYSSPAEHLSAYRARLEQLTERIRLRRSEIDRIGADEEVSPYQVSMVHNLHEEERLAEDARAMIETLERQAHD